MGEIDVSLTPNEYRKMNAYKEDYRLCIVTNALDRDNAKLNIFSYDPEEKCWMDEEKNELIMEEITAARAYVNDRELFDIDELLEFDFGDFE